MANSHPGAFRKHFRRRAFGWRGTRKAIERLNEAVGIIERVARNDAALAGDEVLDVHRSQRAIDLVVDTDADVLVAVKELARRQNQSLGKALSELARQALIQGSGVAYAREPAASFHGFVPFPARGPVVDNETIDR